MSRRSFFSIAIAGSSVVALAAATLAAVPASAASTNELLVEDSFSRTVAQGFGAASIGGSYTTPEPKNMSVNGSQGVLSLTQTMTRSAWVGPSSAEDVDVTNSFGVSALPTAGSVYQGQMVRTNAAGAYYTSRLRIMPDKTIYLGLRAVAAGGSQTTIGSDVTLPFAMAAGTRLISRFQVQGSTLRVKAWAKGSTEPANWQLTGTSTALPSAGRTGVWSYLGGGTNSLDVTVDDLRVESLTPANVLPSAAFTTSVNNLALAVDASGSADSDGTISSYAWDFGDGTSGTGKTATKTYAAAGTYPVKLTVTDNRGGTATITKQVSALAQNVLPTAAFTSSVNDLALAVDAGGSSDSDGTISSYAWDFGDGTSGTGKTATKTYATPGPYSVKLTVTDNRGGTATVTNQVTAIPPNVLPTAAFTTSVNDLALAVDAGGSADPDGTLTDYAWDFGDGTTGTGKTATKTYAAAGPYSVKLTVTDNRGGKATLTKQVTAIAPNVLPTAAFTTSVNDLALAVDAGGSTDSDGTLTDYAWDFGDGTTGTGKTATKTYATPGPYSVKLTVTDNRGGKATVTNQVTAIAPNVLPTAAFTEFVSDLSVILDAGGSSDSDGTLTDYAWDFGDGTTGTGKTVSKIYPTPGLRTVKLTVTDNRGGKATVSRDVTAIAPNVLPTAAFTTSVNDLALAVDAGGSADPDGTLTDYAWDFGDGTSGTGKTATKTYAAPGPYSVKLTVTDNRGGKATVTNQVTAIAPNVLPTAAFTSSVNDLALAVDAGGSSDSDGTLTDYAWDFGDGTSGTGKTATKTYAAAGPYSVKLTVTDNRGGKATVTNQVTAIAPNVLPTAAFTSSVIDLALAVDAGGSADPDGTLTDYAWDFGDGTSGTGKTATKT